jgi:hypothetical protein
MIKMICFSYVKMYKKNLNNKRDGGFEILFAVVSDDTHKTKRKFFVSQAEKNI